MNSEDRIKEMRKSNTMRFGDQPEKRAVTVEALKDQLRS